MNAPDLAKICKCDWLQGIWYVANIAYSLSVDKIQNRWFYLENSLDVRYDELD